LLDYQNCVEISKSRYYIEVFGENFAIPGLVYTYTIEIEKPADGLTVTPFIRDTTQISFSPE